MKSIALTLVGVLALSAAVSAAAIAAPPAPTVTVAATDIKQLQFDITPVPQVIWYELWFKANAGASWSLYTKTPAQRPLFRISNSVHLLDWKQARYLVKACNPSGCSSSSPVGVNGQQLAAMGYFKPLTAGNAAQEFGARVAASADGKTIAVASNETVGNVKHASVVHVYRKTTATSGWRREARLFPDQLVTDGFGLSGGDSLAISGDGNLIAVGQAVESLPGSQGATGVVYLFRRIDGTWRRTQKITGNPARPGDGFGYILKLDDAGRTLAVIHRNPATVESRLGTLEIYRIFDDSSSEFVHDKTLEAPRDIDGEYGNCAALALSGDGITLMRSCTYDPAENVNITLVYGAPGWTQTIPIGDGTNAGFDLSYDGSRAVVENGGVARIYRRETNGYVLETQIAASRFYPASRRIAISRDGKIVALGDANDTTVGLGPIYPPYQTGGAESGKVAVYELKSTGRWLLRRMIKPGSTNSQLFGHAVALGDNGRLLVVGAPRDASSATGIDGDRDDDSVLWRGAAWIY